MNPQKEVKGFFITFTDEETDLLKQVFEAEGIELSPCGIKQFLFQVIHDELDDEETPPDGPAERVIRGVSEFVRKNPETLRMYAAIAGSILKKVRAGH